MNVAKSLFNQEGTGSQALNAKMEGGQLAGDKTGSSSLEAPGARAMDGPGCCFLPLAHLPKIALRVSPCTLWGHGLQRSLAPGRSAPMAENLNRGESWLQIPEGKEKEAKGQVWSVRVVAREGRTPRRTRMGTEGHKQGRAKQGKLGRVIRSKTNLFRGGKGGTIVHPQTKCRLSFIPTWLKEDVKLI